MAEIRYGSKDWVVLLERPSKIDKKQTSFIFQIALNQVHRPIQATAVQYNVNFDFCEWKQKSIFYWCLCGLHQIPKYFHRNDMHRNIGKRNIHINNMWD